MRQPLVPDLALDVQQARRTSHAQLTPLRRGRHALPGVATRTRGPLGLGAWQRRAATDAADLTVYPDLPAARRLALAVREGRYRDAGIRTRGPVGLGTEFERVRDYLPDDDIRQVNWRATARLGRPMSNQHRVEQDQEIVIVLDVGRLMAAPLGTDRTRLDTALDAATALALVADELGDRAGAIAFDDSDPPPHPPRPRGRRRRHPRDLRPRAVRARQRLRARVPDRRRRQARARRRPHRPARHRRRPRADRRRPGPHPPPRGRRRLGPRPGRRAARRVRRPQPHDRRPALLTARTQAAAALTGAGATVVEARPDRLAAACVRAYLRAKSRRRL